MSDWISVRNWRKFQHYDPAKRVPPWIKNNTELMADDAYLSLSGNDRAVLHGLWLEYASSRCRLRLDDVSSTSRTRFGTRSISRRLNLRVTSGTLTRLNHAGFIDFVASAALAEGYHSASEVASARAHATETEAEKEKELKQTPPTQTALQGPARDPDSIDELQRLSGHFAQFAAARSPTPQAGREGGP